MGLLKRRIIEAMEAKEEPPMEDIVCELRSLEVRTDVAYHGDEVRLFNCTMRDAANEIERLRTRWIPYGDPLPEDRQKILAVFQAENGEPWVEAVEYRAENVRDGGLWRSCKVLCWMPLPEPPEVK